MNRRFLALILILVGIGVIIAVLVWMFGPLLKGLAPQPPPLPQRVEQGPTGPQLVKPPPASPATTPKPQDRMNESAAEEQVRRQAGDFAARAGTYSSVDGFASIRDTYVNATPELQASLEAQRRALAQTHPAVGISWGETTRVVASRLLTPAPIAAKTSVEAQIDAQVVAETGDGGKRVSYSEITVSLIRNSPSDPWKVAKITSQAAAR